LKPEETWAHVFTMRGLSTAIDGWVGVGSREAPAKSDAQNHPAIDVKPPPDVKPDVRVVQERLWVEQARQGDARAFRSLFERHAPSVRRFLFDLLRDPEAADEATQETFVRAHARLGTLRVDDKLRPWLYGIARFVFHEALRARRRTTALDLQDEHEPADRAPSPEALLIGAESDRQLARALVCLDEDRRAALLLRVDHGLGYDEICEVMRWSQAKVKNEIHRARLQLRELLGNYLDGGKP